MNLHKPFKASLAKVLRWQLSPNPQKEEKKNDRWRPAVLTDGRLLTEKGDLLAWLGHATFLIRLNGKTLLTDPAFYGASRLVKREVALPVPPSGLKNIDYLLLSHGHMDHCDQESLRLLARNNPRMEVLTTLRLGALIGKWMPGLKIQEAGWYQEYALPTDSPRVVLLPAMHWYKRTLFDDNQRLWGSFVVQTPRTTLYFSGDSGYDSHFRQVGELFPVDIALMGVGAYSPSFMMQDNHMNPEEATRGFNEMSAKTFVPMHHGTFDLSDEPLGEPVRWLRRLESQGTLKGLKVLDVGEVFNL